MSPRPSPRVPKSQVPTHASQCPRPLVPVPLLYTAQESDFMPERTAVPRLHDIGMSFRTGMKISPRYSYRGELAPV